MRASGCSLFYECLTQCIALIALLESRTEPVFASGGSSGAIVASVARALVENRSLAQAGSFEPYFAAQLLAASGQVIDSVLFLPRFNSPLAFIDSFDVLVAGARNGFIRAKPTDAIAHLESIIGQAVLVIDFFRTADFSEVLRQPDFRMRERMVGALWSKFADAIRVTPADLADALLQTRQKMAADGRQDLIQVQNKIFKLFRSQSDNFSNNHLTHQDSWNRFIESNSSLLLLSEPQQRRKLFFKFVSQLRNIENFDALFATLSDDFFLPDPDRVYQAFQGFDSRLKGRIEIPSNVIVHSTARRAKKADGSWQEPTGLDTLYQVYFTNPSQSGRVAGVLHDPNNNPLQPQDISFPSLLPPERILSMTLALGSSLAVTSGEPNGFVRFPLDLDATARLRLSWMSHNERLLGFGGWLEKVALGTLAQFSECTADNVDLYFYTSEGEGMTRFANMILLGLLGDSPLREFLSSQLGGRSSGDLRSLLAGLSNSQQGLLPSKIDVPALSSFISSANKLIEENSQLRGRSGNIPVLFNHAEPTRHSRFFSEERNVVFRSNRRAMILAAYEFTRNSAGIRGVQGEASMLWGRPFKWNESVLEQPTAASLNELVEELLPRQNN